ncbi:MAG: porin family protein [Planctomycetota bacterium]|jgi:hypothetical protein
MRPILPILCLCASATVASAADTASTYTVRLLAAAWFTEPSGDVVYDDSNDLGDTFDVDDYDLDSMTASPMIEAGVNLPLFFDLHAGVFSYSDDGTDEVLGSSPVRFGDTDFFDSVNTEISVTDFYGEIAWRPINLDLVGVGIGLAVHVIDGEFTVTDDNNNKETLNETIPMPALALRGFVNPLDELGVEAKLHFMAIDIGDVDATYIDAHIMATWRPLPLLGVVGGYRLVSYDLDIDLSGNEFGAVDISLGGPFLGAVLSY